MAILLFIALAAALGGGAYYYSQGNLSFQTDTPAIPSQSASTTEQTATTSVTTSNSGSIQLDLASYQVGCMVTNCKPNLVPTAVEHLTLKAGDTFGAAKGYETGALFELVSWSDSKIVVKLINHISPRVNNKLVTLGADATYSFGTAACFQVNNWDDIVPGFCVARSAAHANLSFDVISKVAP